MTTPKFAGPFEPRYEIEWIASTGRWRVSEGYILRHAATVREGIAWHNAVRFRGEIEEKR